MLVRREAPHDLPAVRSLTEAAFAGLRENTGEVPAEVLLLDALRSCESWIPELSLVAVDARDQPIGHVVCTRGMVEATPALGLGPISVLPDRQGEGVGSALVHAVVAAAEARGEVLIALLGEPAFYSRFGFRPSTEHRIEPPEAAWGEYFQTRLLASPDAAPHGEFAYARPFREL